MEAIRSVSTWFGGRWGYQPVPTTVIIDLVVLSLNLILPKWHVLDVPRVRALFRIKQQGVVDCVESASTLFCIAVGSCSLPDHFVHEMFC